MEFESIGEYIDEFGLEETLDDVRSAYNILKKSSLIEGGEEEIILDEYINGNHPAKLSSQAGWHIEFLRDRKSEKKEKEETFQKLEKISAAVPDPEDVKVPKEHRDLFPIEERACLSYWYPKIKHLQTPNTVFLEYPLSAHNLYLEDSERPLKFLDSLEDKFDEAKERFGTPFFFRTGQTSGKHDWPNTCSKVIHKNELTDRVNALKVYSAAASISGLPTNVWCFREWLDLKHEFTAFSGMPIGPEMRFFVQDSNIIHTQPYWFKDALRGYVDEDYPDWKDCIEEMRSVQSIDFKGAHKKAKEAACAISHKFKYPESAWSVDVCLTVDEKWWIIDMAPAEASYFYDPSGEHDTLEEKVDHFEKYDFDKEM